MAAVFGGFSLVAMILLMAVHKYKYKIMKKLYQLRNNYFFNGYIRSAEITYIQTVMTVGVQFKLFLNKSPFLNAENLRASAGICTFLFLHPVWGAIILKLNRDSLATSLTKSYYQNLYNDIHLTRSPWTIYYWPIFMARKFMFVMIPIVFY